MLKIIDRIELKELERLGFNDEMTPIYYYYGECQWAIYRIEIDKNTRLIDLYVCTGDEDCSIPVNECYDKIFDLIQAGLVEKV